MFQNFALVIANMVNVCRLTQLVNNCVKQLAIVCIVEPSLGNWGGATLPLGGAVAPAKKKKSPPAYILILIGPPNDVHLAPLPISVQYLNSLPGSSFNCRPFYPLMKQNTAHSPLIFKYSKHYPTKQHFIIHSPNQNQKIQNPFFCFSFYSLLVYYVHATAHSPGYSSPQKKKKKPSAQLSPPLKLSPHDPQKKKIDHYFLCSCFLKINHSKQGRSQMVSFQFPLHLFLFFFFFFSTIYT